MLFELYQLTENETNQHKKNVTLFVCSTSTSSTVVMLTNVHGHLNIQHSFSWSFHWSLLGMANAKISKNISHTATSQAAFRDLCIYGKEQAEHHMNCLTESHSLAVIKWWRCPMHSFTQN